MENIKSDEDVLFDDPNMYLARRAALFWALSHVTAGGNDWAGCQAGQMQTAGCCCVVSGVTQTVTHMCLEC